MKTKQQLAEAIVDRLLTTGTGPFQATGDRLAVKQSGNIGNLDNERDLGGWCRGAAINQVLEILTDSDP